MAELQLTLSIVTPEGLVMQGESCAAVVLPMVDGAMGILPRHAPMVAALRPGVLKYKTGGRYRPIAIMGGFAEVSNDKVTILSDAAEPADHIDVLRARKSKERAEARLRQKLADVDAARAQAALQRAIARLRAAGAADEK